MKPICMYHQIQALISNIMRVYFYYYLLSQIFSDQVYHFIFFIPSIRNITFSDQLYTSIKIKVFFSSYFKNTE